MMEARNLIQKALNMMKERMQTETFDHHDSPSADRNITKPQAASQDSSATKALAQEEPCLPKKRGGGNSVTVPCHPSTIKQPPTIKHINRSLTSQPRSMITRIRKRGQSEENY
jgi:hypothetical protein